MSSSKIKAGSKQTSCKPCHDRKVKCSRTQPCTNCVRRDEECIWLGEPPPLPTVHVAETTGPSPPMRSIERLRVEPADADQRFRAAVGALARYILPQNIMLAFIASGLNDAHVTDSWTPLHAAQAAMRDFLVRHQTRSYKPNDAQFAALLLAIIAERLVFCDKARAALMQARAEDETPLPPTLTGWLTQSIPSKDLAPHELAVCYAAQSEMAMQLVYSTETPLSTLSHAHALLHRIETNYHSSRHLGAAMRHLMDRNWHRPARFQDHTSPQWREHRARLWWGIYWEDRLHAVVFRRSRNSLEVEDLPPPLNLGQQELCQSTELPQHIPSYDQVNDGSGIVWRAMLSRCLDGVINDRERLYSPKDVLPLERSLHHARVLGNLRQKIPAKLRVMTPGSTVALRIQRVQMAVVIAGVQLSILSAHVVDSLRAGMKALPIDEQSEHLAFEAAVELVKAHQEMLTNNFPSVAISSSAIAFLCSPVLLFEAVALLVLSIHLHDRPSPHIDAARSGISLLLPMAARREIMLNSIGIMQEMLVKRGIEPAPPFSDSSPLQIPSIYAECRPTLDRKVVMLLFDASGFESPNHQAIIAQYGVYMGSHRADGLDTFNANSGMTVPMLPDLIVPDGGLEALMDVDGGASAYSWLLPENDIEAFGDFTGWDQAWEGTIDASLETMGKKRARDKQGSLDAEVTAFSDLSTALDAISKDPFRHDIYPRALEMADGTEERDMVRQLWLQTFPLDQDQYIEWIADRQAIAKADPSEESCKAVLELFELAGRDVQSIALMQLLVDYLIGEYYAARALLRPDADEVQGGQGAQRDDVGHADLAKQAIWSDDFVIALLQRTAVQSSFDYAQSHRIWLQLFTFMRDLYQRRQSDELKERIKDFFLLRLGEPHAHSEQTLQEYSSFTSATDQLNYEANLVEAQTVYGPAKAMYEKHERQESRLGASDDPTGLSYIHYATSLEKSGDNEAAAHVFERGIAFLPTSLDLWEAYLRLKYSAMRKEMEDGDFEKTADLANDMLQIANRAVRFVPDSAITWNALLSAYERLGDLPAVEIAFQRALSNNYFSQNVDELVKLYIARADIHRQAWQEIVAGESSLEEKAGFVEVDTILKEGIERVDKAAKEGDPQFRLERYLVSFDESAGNMQEAIEVLAQAANAHKRSYAIWTARADLFVRHNHIDMAREVYREALRGILDYPEYLFDAYLNFEHHHGSMHQIHEAQTSTAAKMRAIQRKRQEVSTQSVGDEPNDSVQTPAQQALAWQNAQTHSEAEPMHVDVPNQIITSQQSVVSSSKRLADAPSPEASSSKKLKLDPGKPQEPKRDRERTTVIISDLPDEAEEDDLKRLFKDCGDIHEIKLFPGKGAATIEFVERESVPMAKTKDKKIVRGKEVAVNAAWASTLWLTNFPEGTDDAGLRGLLGPASRSDLCYIETDSYQHQHGQVLETRWPDKNFKSTRRFAYATMSTERAAHSAIAALHGNTLEGSKYALSVAISDPERRQARSDAAANAREVRVTNLRPSVNSELLTKVFEECGTVKAVRLDGKGNAFVEYEEEVRAETLAVETILHKSRAQSSVATAVQTLNDHELAGKHIAVTRVDHRGGPGHRAQYKGKAGKAKSDFQARIVRITGLPPHAQSGLLRQELEKHSLEVVEIGMDNDGAGASVEFASIADAGRAVLLAPGSVVVLDTPLTISDNSSASQKAMSTASAAKPADPVAFAPRTVRGGGPPAVASGPRGRGAGRGGRGGFAGGSRPGIGAAKANGHASSKGQDAFRAMFKKADDASAMQD